MSLKLFTTHELIVKRDYEVADDNLIDPTHADRLEQGQWVHIDDAEERVDVGAASAAEEAVSFQVWTLPGSWDVQANRKVTVLRGQYEAETDQFDALGAYAIGTALYVDADGVLTSTAGTIVKGYVVVTAANNNGNLKFYTV